MLKTLLWVGLMASVACAGKPDSNREAGRIVFSEVAVRSNTATLLSNRTDFECGEERVDETLCWTTAGIRHCMDGLDGLLAIVDTGVAHFGQRTMSWTTDACFDEQTPRMRLVFDPPVSRFQVNMGIHPKAGNDRVAIICWIDIDHVGNDAWGWSWSPDYPQDPGTYVDIGIGSSPPIAACDFIDAEVDNIIVYD